MDRMTLKFTRNYRDVSFPARFKVQPVRPVCRLDAPCLWWPKQQSHQRWAFPASDSQFTTLHGQQGECLCIIVLLSVRSCQTVASVAKWSTRATTKALFLSFFPVTFFVSDSETSHGLKPGRNVSTGADCFFAK